MEEVIQALQVLEQDMVKEVEDGLTSSESAMKLCRQAGAEGSVLLENNEFFPIKDEPVAVFGRCQWDTFYVGYGSGGDIRAPYRLSIAEGFIQNGLDMDMELCNYYKEWSAHNRPDEGSWGNWPMYYEEAPISDEQIANASKKAKKAIMIIGRAAGEDRESLPEEGSWYLTKAEIDIIHRLKANFDKVGVILNIGSIMDMSFYEELKLDGMLCVWQGGQETGNAVYDVVSGKINPCGKLSDTVARIEDYPSNPYFGDRDANAYAEDIYVGYRYFETFARDKVVYPFGYGLSYTTFSMETVEASSNKLCVKVKNNGDVSGKEVVQVYGKAPNGLLGKPARQLIGFEKTKVLEPGEAVIVEIQIDLQDLASYDDSGVTGHKNAWVMEKGCYRIFVGRNARNCEAVLTVDYDEDVIVKQCQENSAPVVEFKRMVNRDKQIVFEDVPTRTVDKRERILAGLKEDIEPTEDKGYTFDDLMDGKVTMEEFIAQLTIDELEALSRGSLEGMDSALAVKGNAGVFGGVEESLRQKKIPVICTDDGPSGVRLQAHTTLFPNGVALACTFDKELIQSLSAEQGFEVVDRGSMVLLAPGMNIHRHPLCGRNFEYFSEDPFLTGKIAASYIKGIQKFGASSTVKHFACNNQETHRHMNDSILSQRALREIYLKGFEICLREAKPDCVMTSYNKINGEWAYNNYELVTGILRDEWGFEGLIMTDWWIVRSACEYFKDVRDQAYRVRSGVNVFMPGSDRVGPYAGLVDGSIAEAVASEEGITLAELQLCAKYVLALGMKHMRRLHDKEN